ncbi:hypothetical protein [Deinococcus ficus]|uniref:DUF3592 domain-containing protein n=1 Tax=Deinococcus ficus TaxID=317577 RepID=A0A221T203_9DEIO|nr:hypothetical protein [Deinococcus ficus]ASN82938.1 hypothetical protein DFI_17275 [Deinococcus ficus]
MRALLLLALVLLSAAPPVTGLHYRVTSVDRVEREFRAAGQSRPVVGVFSTTYKIAGRKVTPTRFWTVLQPGDELDAKVRHHPLFSVAVAADINLKERP